MSFEVKIIADSIGRHNRRLTTFQLKYPRYIHAEVLTHRMFSRSASSSRAIPVEKLANISETEMVYPCYWGMNQSGMQAKEECLTGDNLAAAKEVWERMARVCRDGAKELARLQLHKQWANRPLEWFSDINVVLTATEYDNWNDLRAHADAQPEIHILALGMNEAFANSAPVLKSVGDWHLPYLTQEEITESLASGSTMEDLAKISSARCCRVSYLNHDGTKPNIEADMKLFNRLAGSVPAHMSPLEHSAMCAQDDRFFANLRGWSSFRTHYEQTELANLNKR